MSSMSKKMVNSAVALGCMLFAAPVMAHEALNEYVLDPMMVTAARYEQRDIDLLQPKFMIRRRLKSWVPTTLWRLSEISLVLP